MPPAPASTPPVTVPAPPAPERAGSRGEAWLRVTVHPATDVLLPSGARLGDVRADLAELVCRPEMRTAALLVDGVPVDDDQRCGTRPLLPGATVAVVPAGGRPVAGTARPDAVLAAPLHVAVLAGKDAGRLVAVPDGAGRTRVDALDVRHRGTRRGTRVRARVPRGTRRVPDDAGVLVARPAGAGRRVASWRTVRWRTGDALATPDGVYALRPRPLLVHGPRTGPDDPAPVDASPGRPSASHLATAAVPAVASLALAMAFRQPLYALLALVGPLALLVPALVEARRRRAARRGGGGPGSDARRSPGDDGARTTAPVDPLRPRPADALTWATVARLAPVAAPPGGAPPGAGADPSAAAVAAVAPVRLPDGCVAVVGPRALALAAARAVLGELLSTGALPTLRHPPHAASDWAWCRWLPRASAVGSLDAARPPTGPATVLVVDGAPPAGELARAWERLGPAGTDLLLVLDDAARVPAWCRTVVDVAGPSVVVTGPDDARTVREHVGASEEWAVALARRLAAADHLGRLDGTVPAGHDPGDPASPSLPADVALGDLLGLPGEPDELTAWVDARWQDAAQRDGTGLRAALGVGAGGAPVTVDLVRDGPHVLVAGTTGAGKSELLQTLVTGLALGRSPAELSIALVDFKGGASFGACGLLPHVVGTVTDLDPGLAGRALAGLRSELRRRERVLAAAGATSVDELPRGRLPRLVVVVDEFRALADDLPDLLPGLLRVAAQGRSLGVHLVLATQRPAGAVSADVRANITLRLALRVVDAADSRDVVESPLAALVPASAPGRLVLRRGAEPPLAVQCARAGAPARVSASGARGAPPWGVARGLPHPASRAHDGHVPGTGAPRPADDRLSRIVAAARDVAERAGLRPAPPPWLPALPDQVGQDDLADLARAAGAAAHDGRLGTDGRLRTTDSPGDAAHPGDGRAGVGVGVGTVLAGAAGLPVALGDVPDLQRRTVVRWDPRDGHLAVLGRARSGRTTALRTVGRAALARGWAVHAVGSGLADLASHPGTGTVVDRDDPRRLVRLLRLLAGHDDGQERPARSGATDRVLLLVDDVDAVRSTLAGVAGGAGADALADVLTGPAAVAMGCAGPTVAGLSSLVGVRAVMVSRDRHDDVTLGAPSALAGQGGPAGRAVWLGPAEPVLCQLALSAPPPEHAPGRSALPAADGPGTPDRDAPPGAFRLAPLPARVAPADLTTPDPLLASAGPGPGPAGPLLEPAGSRLASAALHVPVGRGGDTAVTVTLDVSGGALVVGPPGSGRTSALTLLARHVARAGALRAVVARDDALAAAAGPGTDVVRRYAPADVGALLDAVAAGTRGTGQEDACENGPRGLPGVVVVDDLDVLVQLCVVEGERLAAACRDGLVLLASATTGGAASALRGPLADLRGVRAGIVLAPGERGSTEVFGRGLEWLGEPGRPRPGRGVLVQGARLTPVQLALPSAGGRGSGTSAQPGRQA
ncbi:FtsK/SpoIIIE domain-containing protein [Cellulosimicrobium cellulans]|uniref:FtsK/SpoIIIE domain-containing protein n=1 Tax=Cellulosimicrobium cellulans TaxID=1710 RepID=UPI0024056AB9|nr:FtsK/SpoIIIE domain-containing protein [Cellulosimicrobium cellulans]MDF9875345.1 S-DNA-T family DNA segregation ATPase FtsK/SpoIIIE [Cellulosimicrobium cellulans]